MVLQTLTYTGDGKDTHKITVLGQPTDVYIYNTAINFVAVFKTTSNETLQLAPALGSVVASCVTLTSVDVGNVTGLDQINTSGINTSGTTYTMLCYT